jgi:hypothetical protein
MRGQLPIYIGICTSLDLFYLQTFTKLQIKTEPTHYCKDKFKYLSCLAPGIKRNATSVRLAVPNHGAVDSEKIEQKIAKDELVNYVHTLAYHIN